MAYRILITDPINSMGLDILNSAEDVEVDGIHGLSAAELCERIVNYDALITRSGTPLDAIFFKAASGHLRIAARAGIGIENIDIHAATLAGVIVMNIPEVNARAAAEHAFALLLALCRNVPQANARLREGIWERQPFLGTQLAGKTLGIIGLGRIGRLAAARARAFDMNVIGFDPYVSEEVTETLRVELVEDLDEILPRADFISLHAQLTEETRGLIGAKEFAHMKKGARIINTARGGLIDEAALLDALNLGQVAGAGLDVFQTEPVSGTSEALVQHPHVVATPHLGASTFEAQEDISIRIAQQVLDALRGVGYRNVVNLPFVGEVDYRTIAPFMLLAEKIGSLQMQLLHQHGFVLSEMQVQVTYHGDTIQDQTKPLTVALLKGLLTPILGDSVNYVNAPQFAHDRGLSISQGMLPGVEDYANVIACRVMVGDEKRLIAGSLLTQSALRIVRMDNMLMDALPSGFALVIKSRDVPGVIGQVATLLGRAKLNIAEYRLGRDEPGGTALSFINLDSEAPDFVLAELRSLEPIIEVQQVNL
ncbi:MAG: phosphoglycerate dehydrogenase [Anaerolineae bacterium]|nr:phosphoglycerate dehydrogenase [Anaerolineae bacterium]MCI0611063.1 phosphoglycerate dehydrogenase [Anaerolineae bacterium]